ncbi:TadE/TadG family type IV pilus assembly protein [Robiginitomaculum antarcticum]|uniref:TadE/TadG family type IV pilus assembly protein n=1 Tax=Robiginitomaculum antarcticum TaxID=437507 RepID=UPI0003676EB0|nr:TadE family protein [Robiginitomaculum antarcticum]
MIGLSKFCKDKRGVSSVEFALLSTVMISITAIAIDLASGFFQYNTALQAARIGARLAATSDPVSDDLKDMTGMEDGAQSGDPLPDYTRICKASERTCSGGQYHAKAMSDLIYGTDNDQTCGSTTKRRRGMCDVFKPLTEDNVHIEYRSSGLGTAGYPATPAPMITVKLTNVRFNFVLIGALTPKRMEIMPDIEVTVMAEDLKSGA